MGLVAMGLRYPPPRWPGDRVCIDVPAGIGLERPYLPRSGGVEPRGGRVAQAYAEDGLVVPALDADVDMIGLGSLLIALNLDVRCIDIFKRGPIAVDGVVHRQGQGFVTCKEYPVSHLTHLPGSCGLPA